MHDDSLRKVTQVPAVLILLVAATVLVAVDNLERARLTTPWAAVIVLNDIDVVSY